MNIVGNRIYISCLIYRGVSVIINFGSDHDDDDDGGAYTQVFSLLKIY